MYNLMIVDDDQLVRKRILSAIPFAKLDLHLCAEAEDGPQTLELFAQYHPQIIIMDINIPLINGIDIAKQILAENMDVSVIIVTGFGTVDFAREAIRNGMVDFLLKPINFQELEDALQRIVSSMHEQAKQTLERQRMERLLERSMPLLRTRYFLSLMTMPPADLTEADCRLYLKDFGINEPVCAICAAIICPNYNGFSVNEQMPMQAVLEEELIKAVNAAGLGCMVLFDSMQRAILVVYSAQKNPDYMLEERLSVLRDRMRYVYRMDFHASIGSAVGAFCRLQDSYHSAEQALGYWTAYGDNNIVNGSNLQAGDLVAPETVPLHHGDLIKLLLSADFRQVEAYLSNYFNRLVYASRNSVAFLQQKTVELLARMLSSAQELGDSGGDGQPAKAELYRKVLFCNNIAEMKRIVLDAAAQLMQEICGKQERSKNRAITSIKRYVLQNFANPALSLGQVSEQVNLSPGYVSQLFKKTEDCTFSDYINRVRVEQAKKLLTETHLRVYEISEAVGYQNSKYFFQVFKQLTGKRPKEFYESAALKNDKE